MKYPILYAKNETDFFSLGLGVMTNTLEASVTEERNGSFYFESKILIDVVIYPQLENDQLIKVDAGHELKDQRFRIKRIVDNHNGTASIYAEHISYLSAELSLKPEVTVSGNGSTALTIWKSSLIGANSFVVDSDITTSNSAKWRIDKVQNARQALGGVEGSILEKWGGEYRFDNYHISLLSKRGTTADVLLAYGRNITDFEQERNIANTFNSVYPFAIYTDDKQQEHLITLSDYFVDSANIASFPNRKAQTVDFSSEFDHENIPTQDKLKSLAQKYIKANDIGVPSVSIKVSFVDLSKTSDYENIAPLEQLNLCDEVHVIYPKLKVNTTAKVVRVVWNVLAESYDEIEIGEKRVSLSDKISEQTKFIDEVKTSANAALVSANGKNTNFYGLFGEDGKGEPKATKVGDLWYKPNGDKSELYQWNGTVWSFIISNDWQEIFNAKLTEELTKAKVELDAALLEKDKALAVLNEKIADELVVIDTSVKKAQADANTATTRADDTVDKANANVQAIEANTQLINDVNAIANTANDNANKAIGDVGKLSEDVLALDTIANQAKSDADTALINANKGITDAKTALNKAIGVDTRVTTEITNVNNTFATKANSTTVDALSDTVSSQGTAISQNATDIKLKADSTVVNAIEGTVDSQGTLISQNASDIALKANKSSVDTLTGRVSANETAIDVTAQGVSTLVTKTDGTNTSLSQFKQDYEGFKGTVYTKGQTDTKVSTVQQSVDNFKTTVSNTYSSKSETDNKVTAVQANVDKIGNYTAYSYSPDGTDRFTTVYPNLNLLDGTRDFSGADWRNVSGVQDDGTFKGLIIKSKSSQWNGLYKPYTVPEDGDYTFSTYILASADGVNPAMAIRKNGIVIKNTVLSTTMFDMQRFNYVCRDLKKGDIVDGRIDKSGTATGKVSVAGHKWEKGSTATPWMPSEKELTSNDIPKYVGYSVRQSENPKDFSWQPYSGLNSYKIIEATTSIDQNADNIALKANKTEVDTLSGKVLATESSLQIQDGKISALNTKTDGHTTQIGTLESSYNGFKTTVANTYADKVSVASQINQSATAVTSNVQSWTNNKLTAYSTTQQTDSSITNAVAGKADKSQVTQLSNQITSTVTSLTNETLITTQMIQSTTLKNQTYPDMPMVELPVTNGESYTVSSNIPNSGTEAAAIADIWYLRLPETVPISNINGVFEGKSITLPALSNKIYIVFKSQSVVDKVASGQYWVKVTKTPASQSQITQLATDINLRVSKGDIVNQINISPESILIAGNKVQITGQTYIENGVIENAKIKDLSASKLTAGTIDASLINVTKINASNITTGTLSADRIAANSITATHISISSLSALSANLGTVTAGTINAATVNIININANSITTGTLSADRIGANSITADKIKATSIDLFNNDTYTNIRADGMRIQSKAQIVFGNWRDSSDTLRTTQGVYIGGFGGGTKHLAFTRSNGTTFMLRAEQGMDYGTNQNVRIGLLNIYDSTQFWESINVKRDIITSGYIAMGGAVQESSIQYDNPAGTMNFRVPGGRSGSYFWFNQRAISEGSFDSRSKLSLKNVKGRYEGNALREIVNTDIAEYSYKNDPKRRQLSPIIDDINEIKKYHLPDIINDGESVNLYAMGSLSWLAIKQLAKKLENIEEKLDAIA